MRDVVDKALKTTNRRWNLSVYFIERLLKLEQTFLDRHPGFRAANDENLKKVA